MTSSPLQGIELLNCAKSDPYQDINLAAQRCGYGDDLVMFEEELKKAARAIGVEIHSFNEWIDRSSDSTPDQENAPKNADQI